jgi:pimeloyl-ACP methyl ester carboxylesterase
VHAPKENALQQSERGVFVRVDDGSDVHVVVDGDPGADIVAAFIHGLPGSSRDFYRCGRRLARAGGCAVRIDMPGFGRSPPSPAVLTDPAARADVVADVMRRRGHRRYAVFGHSFGGTAALSLAARYPEVVTALGLVCSVGITRHQGLSIPHEVLRGVVGLQGVPLIAAPVLGRAVAMFRRATDTLGIRVERPFSDEELIDQMSIIGGLDFAEQRRCADAVTAKTLVVSAQDDRLVEPEVARTLAAALRHAALVSHLHRRRGGHFLQHHAADAIVGWLVATLRAAR